MKIIPIRTMRLGGKHLERATPVDVTEANGAHAIRHGWAVAAPAKPGRGQQKAETAAAGDSAGNDDAAAAD
jgi:hypothetical protein